MDQVQRRGLQATLDDGPVEKAAEDGDEVVEAAGPVPRTASDEALQQRTSQLVETEDAVLVGKIEEQAVLG